LLGDRRKISFFREGRREGREGIVGEKIGKQPKGEEFLRNIKGKLPKQEGGGCFKIY